MRLLLDHPFTFNRHTEEPEEMVHLKLKRKTSSLSELTRNVKAPVKGTAKFGGGLKGVREEE